MTTTDQQYIPLRAGETRQQGDERRETPKVDGKAHGNIAHGRQYASHKTTPPGPWTPVTNLLGHVILPADLILHEYRRPLP